MSSRDFATEIAAAAGDPQTLLAIAIELAGENRELRALADRDAQRRQRQADRKKRSRSRPVTGQDGTERDVTESHETERDTAGQGVTASPLPIPSPSFPTPHLTTPLTPLPSPPPPPARAHEAEPDRPHSELEVRLAERLVSDADRNALTALIARLPGTMDARSWLSEMHVSLEGMPGHVVVTPEQLGQALRDYVGNGAMANPGLKHFRTYLRRAAQPVPAHAPTDDFDTALEKWAAAEDAKAKEGQHA